MALGTKTLTIPSVVLDDTRLSDLFFNREHRSCERPAIREDAIAFARDMGISMETLLGERFVEAVVEDFFARL